MGTAMYAAASAAEGAAGSESHEDHSSTDAPKSGDEDVVDAEVIDETEEDKK